MKESARITTYEQIKNRFSLLRTLAALALALLIAFGLITLVSENAMADMVTLLTGPFSSGGRIVTLVNKWIPLLFTGTAICLIFSTGQVNLAVEGGFFAGAFVGTIVSLIKGVPPGIHFVLAALAAALAGAIIVGIPAILNAKFNVLTIVSSLMINYIALFLGLFLISNPFRDPAAGFEASYRFQESAQLPDLFPGSRINSGVIIALLVVALGYYLRNKSTFGLKIRTIGMNSKFAKFSGMPVAKTLVLTQLIGGAIAGLGGATEVLGLYQRFSFTNLTGHGWDGVMLAVLARNNPKNIPLAALFLAYLRTSADVLSKTSTVPTEVINIVQAVIIIFISAERFLAGWEKRAIIKNSQTNQLKLEGDKNEQLI